MAHVKPAYKTQAAPKVVSRGSLSKPKKLAKWNPGVIPANATPRKVQAPL